jgi:hypothetical protein
MTEVIDRTCPSCRMRRRITGSPSPNFNALPIDKNAYKMLVQAAEAFDRAASNLEAEEGASGAGDGETLFTAADFVAWIKADCIGFRDGRGAPVLYDVEGGPGHPFELPQADFDPRRRGAA